MGGHLALWLSWAGTAFGLLGGIYRVYRWARKQLEELRAELEAFVEEAVEDAVRPAVRDAVRRANRSLYRSAATKARVDELEALARSALRPGGRRWYDPPPSTSGRE